MRYLKNYKAYRTVLVENTISDTSVEIDSAEAGKPEPAVEKEVAKQPVKPSVRNVSPEILQKELQEWSETYSQTFKFINDKPIKPEVTKEVTGQFDMLMQTLSPEYRQKASEGIKKMVDILSDTKFEGQTVQIIGHTSTPGPKGREVPYNQSLSDRRASIVMNAIKDSAVTDGKSVTKIVFETKGMGLSQPIITNDKTLDKPLLGKNKSGSLSPDTVEKLSKSVEERQKINRRVIVTLPNFKEPLPVEVPKPVVKEEPKPLAKTEVGKLDYDPSDIVFNNDSYFLKPSGVETLSKIAAWVNANKNIETITLSAHAERDGDDAVRDKMMYVLTLNRALVTKKFLEEKITRKVNIVYYGCGTAVAPNKGDYRRRAGMDEKRVELVFNADMPIAKAAYESLKNEFTQASAPNIIPNALLKKNIIKTIEAYFENRTTRRDIEDMSRNPDGNVPEHYQKIPIEFWISASKEIYSGEEDPNIFRGEVRDTIKRLNRTYKVDVKPEVFFHSAYRKIMMG
jgi:outer membrane protein OmpA-like peptidoglycan-associated protein